MLPQLNEDGTPVRCANPWPMFLLVMILAAVVIVAAVSYAP